MLVTGCGSQNSALETLTMTPVFCWRMVGTTAFMVRIGPKNLASICVWAFSRLIKRPSQYVSVREIGACCYLIASRTPPSAYPALLMRTSTGPRMLMHSAIPDSKSGPATSKVIQTPPSISISATASGVYDGLREDAIYF